MNASSTSSTIKIQGDHRILRGVLEIPTNARSIIVFAHGLDSSNLSPRNRLVARSLRQREFATLQPNLTEECGGGSDRKPLQDRGGILQTASRLIASIDWLADNPATRGLRIGLFGARPGAAAAIIAAALRPTKVHAVVFRGGLLDLAEDLLAEVEAPTLMLVGSNDKAVIDHNRKASEKMRRKPMLELIQGASHLFGEPGKLEQVASISYLWFQRNLARCG